MLRPVLVIKSECVVNFGKGMEFAGQQDGCPVAMRANVVGVMRHKNHGSVLALFKQFDIAFFMKTTVTNSHNFINLKAVKLDGH